VGEYGGKMQNERAVTGKEIFRTGRLIAKGPLTTIPGIPVAVERPRLLPQDRPECTCVLCDSRHTQSQTIPASRLEENKLDDHHAGR